MRLNLVLIGAPGSGKGTQALRVAERYKIPHISTGDTLRAAVKAGTPLGRQVATIMAAGGLVGDDVMTELVRERLAKRDAASGFVLDGYPRTVGQADALDEILHREPLIVALIDVADQEIIRRLGSRRVCASCGITQSVSRVDEGQTDPCPYCGGKLVRRQDDAPDTVCRRLTTYAAAAEPLIAFYRSRPGFGVIDGLRDPNVVMAALSAHIDAARVGGGA
jgi:adenylate kinase